MGQALSKVNQNHTKLAEIMGGENRAASIAAGLAMASGIVYIVYTKGKQLTADKDEDSPFHVSSKKTPQGAKQERVAVDGVFFKRLWGLLKILIPGVFTAEMGYVVMVAFMMLARTWCDVWMLKNGTAIEGRIIARDYKGFLIVFLQFVLAAFPIAGINNLMKYGLNELALRFRVRLSRHLFQEYLSGFTYYKVTNLDNRIANADQLLTQDVERFCTSVAELYSNISKPVLDILIYARKLSGEIGIQGPMSMLGYLLVSGVVLTRLRRPIGRFTVKEQRLEGEFRYVNSRLITNSEEVAFYNGNLKEKKVIDTSFGRLVSHLRDSMQFRCLLGIVDSLIAKYFATVVGYLVVSRPFFQMNNPKYTNSSQSELMEDYYRNGRMLLNLAMAVGRLVLAGRELTRLAGFTARVTELQGVLKDLNSGVYKRTMLTKSGRETDQDDMPDLRPNSGVIVEMDHIIKFDKVPIVTPNGDVLIRSLSFEVRSGMNVLVCGPNGCGKSSLFRILGELWPLFGGVLTKPAKSKLFYIPQRPYLALGSLRDQVIYPHTKEDAQKKGADDEKLFSFLEQVQLSYLVDREGGWDSVQDWADVLSGGEKQRIAMARLFYHCPQFAILDECTSAVSVDVEGFMYDHCRELGITLFTVSHRKSLWKYHEYVLQFDGRGQYDFKEIKDSEVYGS